MEALGINSEFAQASEVAQYSLMPALQKAGYAVFDRGCVEVIETHDSGTKAYITHSKVQILRSDSASDVESVSVSVIHVASIEKLNKDSLVKLKFQRDLAYAVNFNKYGVNIFNSNLDEVYYTPNLDEAIEIVHKDSLYSGSVEKYSWNKTGRVKALESITSQLNSPTPEFSYKILKTLDPSCTCTPDEAAQIVSEAILKILDTVKPDKKEEIKSNGTKTDKRYRLRNAADGLVECNYYSKSKLYAISKSTPLKKESEYTPEYIRDMRKSHVADNSIAESNSGNGSRVIAEFITKETLKELTEFILAVSVDNENDYWEEI